MLIYFGHQFVHYKVCLFRLHVVQICVILLWHYISVIHACSLLLVSSHLISLCFSTLVALLELFFSKMTLTRLFICRLIERNVKRTDNSLPQYYPIRKKLMNDFVLFTAISNTFGTLFLSATLVFVPISANMTLWILVGGVRTNILPLFMLVNQFLLIFVSHWYLTKCSLQVHLTCRPLLFLNVVTFTTKRSKFKTITATTETHAQLKLANDICAFYCKRSV